MALPKSNVSKRCRGNCKHCRPWSDCSSRSSLIWVCTVCPDLSVWKLRIITVHALWVLLLVNLEPNAKQLFFVSFAKISANRLKSAISACLFSKDLSKWSEFSDRQVLANSADPDQTALSSLIRVYTVCHSACIFWNHYSVIKWYCSNFRIMKKGNKQCLLDTAHCIQGSFYNVVTLKWGQGHQNLITFPPSSWCTCASLIKF